MSSTQSQRLQCGIDADANDQSASTYLHKSSPHSTKQRKHTLPRHQRTIFEYMPFEQQQKHANEMYHNEPWGHSYTSKDSDTIRVWFTNPNGLGLNPINTKSHNAFQFLSKKSQSDVTCLVETNLRWPDLHNKSTLNSRLRATYQEFQSATSYNKHENSGKLQRGGTCVFATGQLSYRVHKRGSDSTGLGRWSWMQFSGRGNHRTRVISAYRPCAKSTNSKLTTVRHQHSRYYRKNNIMTDPREKYIIDLEATLTQWIQDGIQIVFCVDANEDLQHGRFHDMTTRLGLLNAGDPHGNQRIPATHNSGTKPIAGISFSPTLDLIQFGMLAHGEGIEGDHRNIYADFHETTFLGTEMFTIIHPKRRRLKLYDIRIVTRFNNSVLKHFKHNNLDHKISELQNLPTTTPHDVRQRHLDSIDDQVGRAITNAEQHCRKLCDGAIPFSSKYKEVNTPRRFWLLLLRKKYGKRVSSTTLRRLASKLDITQMYSIDFEEARYQLHQSRRNYMVLAATAKSERDIFNENLAKARAEYENTTASRALRRIIKEEEQRSHNSVMATIYRKLDNKRLD